MSSFYSSPPRLKNIYIFIIVSSIFCPRKYWGEKERGYARGDFKIYLRTRRN
jgi:hypothetical protein